MQALAESLLGVPLAAPSAAALLARARGNPGLVTALLDDLEATGRVAMTAGGAVVERFAVTPTVVDLAGIDPFQLPEPVRELAELLAVAGVLPTSSLHKDAVAAAFAAGLVRAVAPGTIELIDALVADVVLESVDAQAERELAARAAQMLQGRDGQERLMADLLALAGQPDRPEDVVHAARRVLGRGRPGLALDVLGTVDLDALDDACGFDLHLVRSAARAAIGTVEEAIDDLDAAADLATSDRELVLVAEQWMLLLGGRGAEDRALEQRIDSIIERLAEPGLRAQVTAALARRRAIVGELRGPGGERGVPGGDDILVALRDSLSGTRVSALTAEPDRAELVADTDDLDALLTVLAKYLTLVYDGDLERAREVAQIHYERDAREGRPSLGLWTYNRAKMAFHAGQYELSAELAEEAVRHLAWRDVTGQAVPADAMLAAVLARLGQQSRAEQIVASIDDADALLPRVAIGVARVEAERLRANGGVEDAVAGLVRAGESAMQQGEVFSGVLAIDEAFMIRPSAVLATQLERLTVTSPLVDAFIARAGALVEGDADRLADAARALEHVVQPGRAAHAWHLAAEIWTGRRKHELARRASQQAVRVASIWQADAWPRSSSQLGALTPRELDIARIAAGRVRSREIAEQLSLSVRTVDNHLARAFRKLGISSRDELTEALDLDGGPHLSA